MVQLIAAEHLLDGSAQRFGAIDVLPLTRPRHRPGPGFFVSDQDRRQSEQRPGHFRGMVARWLHGFPFRTRPNACQVQVVAVRFPRYANTDLSYTSVSVCVASARAVLLISA